MVYHGVFSVAGLLNLVCLTHLNCMNDSLNPAIKNSLEHYNIKSEADILQLQDDINDLFHWTDSWKETLNWLKADVCVIRLILFRIFSIIGALSQDHCQNVHNPLFLKMTVYCNMCYSIRVNYAVWWFNGIPDCSIRVY